MDGDGISSSGDVSSMAADEGPGGADPELTETNVSPPMVLSPENILAQILMLLYNRNNRNMQTHGVQLDDNPNMDATDEAFVGGDDDHPRHGDADADADAGAYEDYDADADSDAGAYDDDDDDNYVSFVFGALPASGVAIACLPETTVGEGEARDSSGMCAVCQVEYQAGDALRTMPCAHGFHEHCIFQWLLISRVCPLCRFALPPEEDTETDDDGDDDDALEYL